MKFRLEALSIAFVALLACSKPDELKPAPETRTSTEADAAKPAPVVTASAVAPAPAPSGPLVLARGLRIVHASHDADASKSVRDEQARAKADGRDVVVYVGAKWCEPCQRFHKAADAGLLDADFPTLTLVEFDLDDDRERLASAGYVSQLIPLFALPKADGRASGKQFSGSVKGDGAVTNITPRLRSLLN